MSKRKVFLKAVGTDMIPMEKASKEQMHDPAYTRMVTLDGYLVDFIRQDEHGGVPNEQSSAESEGKCE